MKMIIGFVFCVFMLLCGGCTGCYCLSRVDTTDGFRDGTIMRFAEQGVVFKTWEGELVSGGFVSDGGLPSNGTFNSCLYHFTVSDPEIVKQIQVLKPNERVRFHFRSKLSLWAPNGETRSFVYKIEHLKEIK
jgi:hypothetical protein